MGGPLKILNRRPSTSTNGSEIPRMREPQGRSLARRLLRTAPIFATLLGFTTSALAQTRTGAEVKLAVDPSIDILKDHTAFQAQQDRYDAMLGYLVMTERFSPLKFALDDGTKVSRVGHRAATMIGGGYGSTSTAGFYVGAWTDWITMGPSGNDAVQGLLFGGVALYGFQASYSYFLKQRLNGIDAYGNFGDGKGGVPYYSYIPGGGSYEDQIEGSKDAIALYHTSGASLVVVRDTKATGGSKVSEVRAQLQPLQRWLPRDFGLPMIAVQKLDEARAFARDTRDFARAISQPGKLLESTAQQQRQQVPSKGDPYEVEVGGDDLFDMGVRAHALVRVYPDPAFRRGELGAYRDIDDFTVALRSFAFMRDDSLSLSLDSFVRWSIVPPGEEELGFPFAVAASYSFNSPESTTFVPLAHAHVFGVQLVLGAPDLAKPIVPIVREKKDSEKRSESK